MSVFDDINHTTNKASHIGERYIKASHQYFRLKIFQQLTLSLSAATKALVIGVFLFVGLLFISIAGVIELSKALDSFSLACLYIGLIYLIIALIIYLLRAKIDRYIIKKVGSKFFS